MNPKRHNLERDVPKLFPPTKIESIIAIMYLLANWNLFVLSSLLDNLKKSPIKIRERELIKV